MKEPRPPVSLPHLPTYGPSSVPRLLYLRCPLSPRNGWWAGPQARARQSEGWELLNALGRGHSGLELGQGREIAESHGESPPQRHKRKKLALIRVLDHVRGGSEWRVVGELAFSASCTNEVGGHVKSPLGGVPSGCVWARPGRGLSSCARGCSPGTRGPCPDAESSLGLHACSKEGPTSQATPTFPVSVSGVLLLNRHLSLEVFLRSLCQRECRASCRFFPVLAAFFSHFPKCLIATEPVGHQAFGRGSGLWLMVVGVTGR